MLLTRWRQFDTPGRTTGNRMSGATCSTADQVPGRCSPDSRVIAICHTARLSDQGAEAGTWTDPEFRGRGYAAVVTAAWANQFAEQRKQLYYSTSADNRSSQQVAARLGLRPLGHLWKLTSRAHSG